MPSPLEFKNSVTTPSPLFSAYDPTPNPESTVQGENYRFTVISEGCIRYEYSPDGKFEDRASTFAVHRNLPKPKYNVLRDNEGGLEIKTDRLHLQYDGKAFTASGLYCDCRAKSEHKSSNHPARAQLTEQLARSGCRPGDMALLQERWAGHVGLWMALTGGPSSRRASCLL
jgi:hypothetical protein